MNIYICFPEGKSKALTMSYDDGTYHDERLIDIFNRYGIKGTFNINYEFIRKSDGHYKITQDRVAELYRGHEVATHCLTHPTIARCPMVEVAREILEDRKGLESLTGNLVRGHAYPNGSFNQEIKQLFKQLGVAYGRTTKSVTGFALPEDPLEWNPTCHHGNSDLMKIAEEFADFQKKQYLKLMYVWGHSYEFDLNNNWHIIEKFCEYMGGREDIWYATNIEIVDYMAAAKSLKFSANNEAVYNPSAQSVWLHVGFLCDKAYEIKGGEYVDLNKIEET